MTWLLGNRALSPAEVLPGVSKVTLLGEAGDGRPLARGDACGADVPVNRRVPRTSHPRPQLGSGLRWLVLLLIGLLVLAGCTGRSLISWGSGWSATAASDGVLFVGNKQGEVLAFEAITGDSPREKWRFPREGEEKLGGVFGMPAVGEELLFIADKGDRDGKGGRLFAIGKESGARQWVKGIEGGIVGGPALSESHGLVMVGSDDGSLYAFHAAGDAPGRMAWRFASEGRIWSTPVVGEGAVYFGSMDRHIYALSLDDTSGAAGTSLWKYKTGAAVVSTPLLLDGMVIVGSFDQKLYALDSKTGALLWSFAGDGWFWAGAVSDGEQIYAATMGGTVYALDKKGSPVWSSPFRADSPIVSTPAVVGDAIVVATDAGRLYLLSADTGTAVEVFKDLGARVKGPLSQQGTMVFVGVDDSTVRGVDAKRWVQRWNVSTKK